MNVAKAFPRLRQRRDWTKLERFYGTLNFSYFYHNPILNSKFSDTRWLGQFFYDRSLEGYSGANRRHVNKDQRCRKEAPSETFPWEATRFFFFFFFNWRSHYYSYIFTQISQPSSRVLVGAKIVTMQMETKGEKEQTLEQFGNKHLIDIDKVML